MIWNRLLKSKFISKKMINGKWVYRYILPNNKIKMKPKINTEYVKKSIRITANHIMNYTKNKFESGGGLSSSGKLLFYRKGEKEKVNFTRKELKQLIDGIIVHNHPNNTSFSPEDLAITITGELSEMVVVTNDKIYKYKPPKNSLVKYSNMILEHNKNNQSIYAANDTRGIYNYIIKEILNPLGKEISYNLIHRIRIKELTRDEAFYQHPIIMGREFAKITGGIYSEENR